MQFVLVVQPKEKGKKMYFQTNGKVRGGNYNRGTLGVTQNPMYSVVYKSGGIATVSQTVADDAMKKGMLESMTPIDNQTGEKT